MNKPLKKARLALIGLFLTTPAIAEDLQSLYGQWGTEKQCARALITPKGTKKAAPFDIQSDWLGHGDVWCRINWLSTDPTRVVMAHALCGEDNVQGYRINFILDGSELTLVWNLQLRNGPLMRCSA